MSFVYEAIIKGIKYICKTQIVKSFTINFI